MNFYIIDMLCYFMTILPFGMNEFKGENLNESIDFFAF